MWRVNNNTNKLVLKRYHVLIDNIFKALIDLSKYKNKLNVNSLQVEKYFDKKKNLTSELLKIDNALMPLILNVIKLGEVTLRREYKIFKHQNEQIKKRNYNLIVRKHPDPLKKLFKDYFYSKFFSTKWIWMKLIKYNYSREKFKINFKKDNTLKICPYCDIDTISSHRNSEIEHFLPKGKFPYLSFNYNNLIPSCNDCNVAETGKGENVKRPITNQYIKQIGDEIEFEIDLNGKINIKTHNNDSIENFLDLLQLRNKYTKATEEIIDLMKVSIGRMEFFKAEITKDNYTEYINLGKKKEPYYFVQKEIFKDIDQYL